ncbi:helix-turn-helix domain-containing protein [Sphingomonas mollis]|uniref:helix-turn-helix domain-containing protein n=1 Tax=Sphingomonas mollis TaxID=2795726 RepID=UPI0018ED6143
MKEDVKSDHPLAGTKAARMLAQGIQMAAERDKLSLREIAKALGHKNPSMLSQWANGRVPIPIERVAELADALQLDGQLFMLAVLSQRHPSVDWGIIEDRLTPAYAFVERLQSIAGKPIEEFEPGQVKVMNEVAADPQADRRWISAQESEMIEALRILTWPMADDEVSRIAAKLYSNK